MIPPRSFWIPLIALWIGLFVWGTEAWAETVYVQAKTAQLRAGKTSLDAVVGNVKFGDALEVVGRDGSWVEVKTSAGARGWIFANKTSTSKPSGGNDTLARLGQSMRGGDASATTASAGARGLCRPGRRVRAGSGGSGSHDGLSNPRPGRRRVHAGRRPGRICEITGSG